jgi:predicted oxidoreductase
MNNKQIMTKGVARQLSPGLGGPELSRIVFGIWRIAEWRLSVADRQMLIEKALELGVTTFDHADIYGDYQAEGLFGDALAAAPHLRERMQLVSKCGIKLVSQHRPTHRLKRYDSSFGHVVASVDHSLRALRTDYLDLLLLHRPDPLMDADELVRAFVALRSAGKVRHFGVSNFSPAQFALLRDRLVPQGISLVTNQVECSLLHLDPIYDGTFEQAQQLRCSPMLWSPLAGGRVFTEHGPVAVRVRECLARLASELGASPTAILFAWLLALPCRPLPIVGSSRIEVLRDVVSASHLTITGDHWFELLQAAQGCDVP